MQLVNPPKKIESRKVATIWNFVFLNIGFIISLVNGIIIIPLYLHYINISVYGAWLATGSVLTWITIVDPGVSGVLLQRISFAIGKNDRKELSLAISSGILISSFIFIIALLLGYTLSFFITGLARVDIHYSKEIVGAFRIALWGTAMSLFADTFRNIVLGFQKTKLHGIFLNTVVFISVLVNVVLLISGFGIYALAYTSLFRGGAMLICALFFSISLITKNQLKLVFQVSYFRSFSKVFAFTFSSSLFETLASNMDLILVSRFIDSSAVTMLDISRRPLRISIGNVSSISQAALPTLPHLFGSGDNKKIRETVVRLWTIILWLSSFVICGFLIFNYSFISIWVGKRFWIGNVNSIIICVSIFLYTIGYNLSNITTSNGEMRGNSVLNIVRSSVYIILVLLLGKFFGMVGILVAYLISVSTMVIYYPLRISKSLLTKEDLKVILRESLIILTLIALSAILSFWLTYKLSWLQFIGYGLIFSIIYFSILSLSSKKFKNEIVLMIGTLRQRFKPGKKIIKMM